MSDPQVQLIIIVIQVNWVVLVQQYVAEGLG